MVKRSQFLTSLQQQLINSNGLKTLRRNLRRKSSKTAHSDLRLTTIRRRKLRTLKKKIKVALLMELKKELGTSAMIFTSLQLLKSKIKEKLIRLEKNTILRKIRKS